MSADHLARAVKALGLGRAVVPSAAAKRTGPRFFTSSGFRRNTTRNFRPAATPAPWTGRRVVAVAAAAGAIGWSLSSFGFGGFPGGAMLLDSSRRPLPKYASLREMEWVCTSPFFFLSFLLVYFQRHLIFAARIHIQGNMLKMRTRRLLGSVRLSNRP